MQYANPILPGFHPDPSICRVGEDYYLCVSSFEYFPGLPVYHSRDLVNWTHIGNALQRANEFPLQTVGDSGGMWAPTIRHHAGKFYVTATLENYGSFIVTADDPAGEWSAPVWLPEINGIDPSMYFEDGRCYYCTNGSTDGTEMISLCEVDVRTGCILGERRPIWPGSGAHFLEAPHIYRIGDWYYLLTAEGGTFFTHRATVARSKDLWGPYETCPQPMLTNIGDQTWNVQCAGHADLVDDGRGNWWAVHLGIRLARRTMTHLGRETFLMPVTWQDGWPHIGKATLTAAGPIPAPQQPLKPFAADLTRNDWENEWIFLRRPDMAHHRRVPGAMLLTAAPCTLADKTPTFAGVRPLGFDTLTETAFTFGAEHPDDEAGLAVRLDSAFYITCLKTARGLTLTLHCEDIVHEIACAQVPEGEITLRMQSDKLRYFFYYDTGDGWRALGSCSTRFVATEVHGRCFTGTVIGLYASGRGEMRVSRFLHRAEPSESERT